MTHIIDNIRAENNLTYGTNSPDLESKATSASGSDILTATSKFILVYTGSAIGYSVVLPDATELTNGWKYEIYNTTSQPITLKDKDGTVLGTIAQTTVGYVILQINSPVAGTWIFWQRFIGTADSIVHYNITADTLYSTTSDVYSQVTDFIVTPTAGKYAVWYNANAFTNKNNLLYWCSIFSNGTQVMNTERQFMGISSSYQTTQSTMGIIDFNGINTCNIRVKVESTPGNEIQLTARSLLLIRLGNVAT